MEDKKYENEKRKLKPFQITVLVLIIILVLILLSIFLFISGKWGKVNKVDVVVDEKVSVTFRKAMI